MIEEQVKMVLFARWMATQFDGQIMMKEDSFWYRRQVIHFNEVVYPNYIKNGSVKDHIDGFKNTDDIKGVINDLP